MIQGPAFMYVFTFSEYFLTIHQQMFLIDS